MKKAIYSAVSQSELYNTRAIEVLAQMQNTDVCVGDRFALQNFRKVLEYIKTHLKHF
ncbi:MULTISPECIES: hypothetical protein [Microcoleaceae]|uniref:hypothetical protein n=1 Tax=Microcoleaceae TaxID=1892252 RepID=UPI001880F71F|nr:hypothetical protein [Tychonema sp. LEGE 06208]MBE9162105.1 hypothetical protein [Tychonema sp. LEGE 06208]